MANDPHAMVKVVTCTSLDELRSLLDGWRYRGVTLSEAEQRAVNDKRSALLAVEREMRKYRG